MKYDIFEDEKDKAEARKSLPDLVKHDGWKLIIRALDSNIAFLSDELKYKIELGRDFENLEQLYALQDKIDYLRTLKDLPKMIMQEALPDPPETDEEIY